MLLRFIVIATSTVLTAEMLYKPEEQEPHIEKENHQLLPSFNQYVYNIQTPTGPTFNMKTEAKLVTQLDPEG